MERLLDATANRVPLPNGLEILERVVMLDAKGAIFCKIRRTKAQPLRNKFQVNTTLNPAPAPFFLTRNICDDDTRCAANFSRRDTPPESGHNSKTLKTITKSGRGPSSSFRDPGDIRVFREYLKKDI